MGHNGTYKRDEKRALVILFSTSICWLIYSCSCIPASSQIRGKFKLEKIVSPNNTISYMDSLYFLTIDLEDKDGNSIKYDEVSVNGEISSRRYWASAEGSDDCVSTSMKRVNVTYKNGETRRFVRDSNDPYNLRLEVSESLNENTQDTVTYHYLIVN